MRWQPGTIIVVGLLVSLGAATSHAQLFGERTLGRGLNRGERPQPVGANREASGDAPQLRSLDPQRFVRGQRPAGAFVGVQSDAAQDFVGMEQVAPGAAIRSAIDASVPRQPARRASQINRPLPPAARTGIYPPRYTTAFTDERPAGAPDAEQREDTREERLRGVIGQQVDAVVAVTIEDRTLILEGVVDSDRRRRLAELMASFEPGVDRVVNRLSVQPSARGEDAP